MPVHPRGVVARRRIIAPGRRLRIESAAGASDGFVFAGLGRLQQREPKTPFFSGALPRLQLRRRRQYTPSAQTPSTAPAARSPSPVNGGGKRGAPAARSAGGKSPLAISDPPLSPVNGGGKVSSQFAC